MTEPACETRQDEASRPAAAPAAPGRPEPGIGRIPGITIDAFCETRAVAEILERAAGDRRMARATLRVRGDGIGAAHRLYRDAPTPNLIILETRAAPDVLLSALDSLALVCDTATRVIVIGEADNIGLYRELLKRGVSEYLYGAVEPVSVISAIGGVFNDPDSQPPGRVYACIGAKGGAGSSSVAQNLAWILGRHSGAEVILADAEPAFGTASLNFDLSPESGMAEAIRDARRLDEQMLERLLVQCDDHMRLLAAPAQLDAFDDMDAATLQSVIDLARGSAPHLVLDVPDVWAAWARKSLLTADEVVITAVPDLANLRNARHLVDMLREMRPHDGPPRLVLNQVGMPDRPEIKPAAFAEAVGLEPVVVIAFDAKAFGTAANQGRMVADASQRGPMGKAFRTLAERVSGRPLRKRRLFESLGQLLGRRRSRPAPNGDARAAE